MPKSVVCQHYHLQYPTKGFVSQLFSQCCSCWGSHGRCFLELYFTGYMVHPWILYIEMCISSFDFNIFLEDFYGNLSFSFSLWRSNFNYCSASPFPGDASLYGPGDIWVILRHDLCALLLVNNWNLDMFIRVNIVVCSAPIAYVVLPPICGSINKCIISDWLGW